MDSFVFGCLYDIYEDGIVVDSTTLPKITNQAILVPYSTLKAHVNC